MCMSRCIKRFIETALKNQKSVWGDFHRWLSNEMHCEIALPRIIIQTQINKINDANFLNMKSTQTINFVCMQKQQWQIVLKDFSKWFFDADFSSFYFHTSSQWAVIEQLTMIHWNNLHMYMCDCVYYAKKKQSLSLDIFFRIASIFFSAAIFFPFAHFIWFLFHFND